MWFEIILKGGPAHGRKVFLPADILARRDIRIPVLHDGTYVYTKQRQLPQWHGGCAMPIEEWVHWPYE